MGLSFYYIPRSQISPTKVTHFDIIEKAINWSLEPENVEEIGRFWKNYVWTILLVESGKPTKLLEKY